MTLSRASLVVSHVLIFAAGGARAVPALLLAYLDVRQKQVLTAEHFAVAHSDRTRQAVADCGATKAGFAGQPATDAAVRVVGQDRKTGPMVAARNDGINMVQPAQHESWLTSVVKVWAASLSPSPMVK